MKLVDLNTKYISILAPTSTEPADERFSIQYSIRNRWLVLFKGALNERSEGYLLESLQKYCTTDVKKLNREVKTYETEEAACVELRSLLKSNMNRLMDEYLSGGEHEKIPERLRIRGNNPSTAFEVYDQKLAYLAHGHCDNSVENAMADSDDLPYATIIIGTSMRVSRDGEGKLKVSFDIQSADYSWYKVFKLLPNSVHTQEFFKQEAIDALEFRDQDAK